VETGLFYNRYRYYAPAMGRYVTQDPIGLVGGMHLTLYANANPTNYGDPIGLWAFLLLPQFWMGVGAIVIGSVAVNSTRRPPSFPSSSGTTPQAPTAQSLTDAHKAAGTNRLAPGYGGNCTPDEYDDLKNKKDDACSKAQGLTCGPGVVDYGKVDTLQACADARINVARKCFSGGDKGHNDQINQLQRTIGKCMGRT